MKARTVGMLTTIAVLTASVGIVAVGPAAAPAATFDVHLCADAPNQSAADASASNSRPDTLTTTSACRRDPVSQFDGLAATDLSGAPNTPIGASARWSITAAPGTRIVAARLRRFLGKRDNSWKIWTRTSEGQTLETCEIVSALSCTVGALPTSPAAVAIYASLDTEALDWGVTCGASIGDCTNGASLHSAWAIVYSATLSVNDPAPPQLQPPVGGLVAATPWHSGVEQAVVSASDASGIKRVELLVDGAIAAVSSESCDYTRMRPCPHDAQVTGSVDLTTVSDGVHQVAGRAVDASGQTTTSVSTAIAVDNHAPTAPNDMAVTRNVDETVNARWKNPGQGSGAPIAGAHYQFCPVASDAGCVGGGIVPGNDISSLERVRPPASAAPWDLVVWLQDGAGHADRAAAARQTVPMPNPPPPPPRRPGPSRSQRRTTRLRIVGVARRNGWLRVRGSTVRSLRARVRVALRRTRHGRPIVRRTVVVRNGRYSTRLDVRRRPSLRGYLLTAHFAGSREYRKTTVLRHLGRN